MALSKQTAVSDGTLTLLPISFDFLDRNEISVRFGDDLVGGWSWVGTMNTISFAAPVPAGTVVTVQRTTDITELRHEYQLGAAFSAQSLDESLKQTLHIAQEWVEGEGSGGGGGTGALAIGTVTTGAPGDPADASITGPAGSQLLNLTLPLAGGGGGGDFLQDGVGAVVRAVNDRLRDVVNVKDFGAVGDGVTDDTAAFMAARDYLQTASDYRGGVIEIGRGVYKINAPWQFSPYVTGQVFNIQIRGAGMESTVLDFSGAPSATNGISAIGHGVSFFVSDLSVKYARQHGILIQGGSVLASSTSFIQRCGLKNVRIQGSGADGFKSENSFMLTLDHVWSFNNAERGFHFAGFHTSLNVSTSWASNNGLSGWVLNGAVYSTFTSCGSDENGQYGYAVSNVQGVVFTGCGAESNARDGWYLFTSAASVTGIPVAGQNVRGVVFDGCFGLYNSTAGAGAYATFLAALTSGGRGIDIVIRGGAAHPSSSSGRAIVLNGASGNITCSKDGFYDGAFTAADVIAGAVTVRNLSVAGLRVISGMPNATQSIPSGTDTIVTIRNAPPDNDLQSTIAGSTSIQIPRGVNKVIVTAGIQFEANATGVRHLFIYKNGSALIGLPGSTAQAASVGSTALTLKSAVINVVQGDSFRMHVFQSSGGALNIQQAWNSFLAVEAVN